MKHVVCKGWDDFTHLDDCPNPVEPGTEYCKPCREDIEWLNAPLTEEEEASILRASELNKKLNKDSGE